MAKDKMGSAVIGNRQAWFCKSGVRGPGPAEERKRERERTREREREEGRENEREPKESTCYGTFDRFKEILAHFDLALIGFEHGREVLLDDGVSRRPDQTPNTLHVMGPPAVSNVAITGLASSRGFAATNLSV